jgi:hypothetical protein
MTRAARDCISPGVLAVRHHQCPASPVSGVHVPCLTDSPALARFRRAPMPRPLKLVVEGA